MKVGDLICYNAAGMKYKTLGLVLEFAKPSRGTEYFSILIQWCLVGKLMPRREWSYKNGSNWDNLNDKIQPGQMIWHRKGDWFEVSK
jgi:hypothetical protein